MHLGLLNQGHSSYCATFRYSYSPYAGNLIKFWISVDLTGYLTEHRSKESRERYDGFCEYTIDSVGLVNAQLERRGKRFFFDAADVDQAIIRGKHCWDMYGWVVPNELVHKFEPVWIENDNVELEKYDYVCAGWEDRGGQPYAAIDGSLPEEAYA